jgi:hypothetical protein
MCVAVDDAGPSMAARVGETIQRTGTRPQDDRRPTGAVEPRSGPDGWQVGFVADELPARQENLFAFERASRGVGVPAGGQASHGT